jgi:phenylalanyl-tRNA synthetase alpha chain
MHDTFFMKPAADGSRKLLRTHTSPIQVRTMLANKPPIRVICARAHLPERLGRDAHADVPPDRRPRDRRQGAYGPSEGVPHRGVLKRFFEVPNTSNLRFRPHFFPFTEPSAEMDIRCDRSGGRSRSAKAMTGWKFSAAGWCIPTCCGHAISIPKSIQGFAFGLGVDRLRCSNTG